MRGLGWLFVACIAALAAATAALPVPRPRQRPPTIILDRNDRVVASLQRRNRVSVGLGRVPAALRDGVIATEDARFYAHHGINPASIARALWVDLRAHRVVEGGSTITQQLAKMLFLTPSRTVSRKLLELLYTFKLEAVYSKDQILAMYLNNVYMGNGAYGVEAAARAYFGVDVWRLDLAQCALLAGLPQAPSAYDPFQHPGAARRRRNAVLARMAAADYISPALARTTEAAPLGLSKPAAPAVQAGYFVEYVMGQLARRFPDIAQGGYRVYTTLDRAVQSAADTAFASYMPRGHTDAHGVLQPEGALVALDPHTGGILAMIGGRDFAHDPWNRAVDAHRQPGSTFKPFLYAAVFERGYTTVDRQFDGPVSYPGTDGHPYVPTDSGNPPYLMRDVSVREAVAISDNVVAVRWTHQIGPQAVIDLARRAGITSPLGATLPLALGTYDVTPLEIVDAYIPFDNRGLAVPAWAVRRVENAAGHVLYQALPPRPRPAMDRGVAYLVTSVLQSAVRVGTGRALRPILSSRPVAGKTGTTNDLRDAWFIGYTPDLLAGVWVGDDMPHPLNGYGNSLAGPVWAHFMAAALAGVAPRDWQQPADVVDVRVSAIDGLLPNPTSPVVNEVFLRGTEPRVVSPVYSYTAPRIGDPGVPGPLAPAPNPGPPPPRQAPAPASPRTAPKQPRGLPRPALPLPQPIPAPAGAVPASPGP